MLNVTIHANKQINKFIKSGVSVYTLKFLTGTVVSGLAGQIHKRKRKFHLSETITWCITTVAIQVDKL